jgi:hypothetical protein
MDLKAPRFKTGSVGRPEIQRPGHPACQNRQFAPPVTSAQLEVSLPWCKRALLANDNRPKLILWH